MPGPHLRSSIAALIAGAACSLPGLVAAQDPLDGRWLFAERGGEAEVIGTVAGTSIAFEPIEPGGRPVDPLTRAPDSIEPPYRWLSPDRDTVVFSFVDPAGQYIILNEVGDADYLIGYRLGPPPVALNGAWMIHPYNDDVDIQLTIDGGTGSMAVAMEGESRTGTIQGVAMPGPHLTALMSMERGDPTVFTFWPIGFDLYLVDSVDGHEQAILYRPGAAPPWLGALLPPQPPSMPAPTPQ